MSYLALAKKIQAKIDPTGQSVDPTMGDIVAVLIWSDILNAEVWFTLRNDFQPDSGDTRVIFFADEIPFLKTKTAEILREIHAAKLAFGGGRVRQ